MPTNFNNTRRHLQEFDFRRLLIEDLGWNNPPYALTPADAEAKAGVRFHRAPVAVLSGIHVFEITTLDGTIPEPKIRAAIHTAVTVLAAENVLIFTDRARTKSLWYWVKRESGKSARRPHLYVKGQPGDLFISKLAAMHVEIAELDAAGNLPLTVATARVKKALDVERVTKKFYDRFKQEHAAFLGFIKGIPVKADAEWYASVMLNRMMFVYFIQRKGFLDGEPHYLRNRLARCREDKGRDQFYPFYRYFLIRLFHEGLGGRKRTPELEKLLGRIPYLNGGMFDVHELEKPDRYGPDIHIPDKAFENIFNYFDQYDWVLDPERSVHKPGDKEEINPDVLGYIFEKYINQKQMGAYYTKEDITEYIGKNTVLPFLFDAARPKCKIAFENPNGPVIWDLLRENPDRYIYDAVKRGVEIPLPKEIEAGIKDVSKRDGWNKPASSESALPTEIWREVVARRQRYEEIRAKLAGGEVREINELITLNLDIRQFAQDVIENCEGPDLLRAFWHAIEKLSILDPTCGSGAFLFAALNILEPLYEACLNRMAEFLNDEAVKHEAAKLKFTPKGYALLPHDKFKDFAQILDRVADHPSAKYYIYKSIILNNLFGVDIMEEAVEICKLRLFLKLAAQVEPDATKDNLGIEPLPDIDFNIRAGNTLVGYSTAQEVRRCMKELGGGQMKLLSGDDLVSYERFLDRLQIADAAWRSFRQQQTEIGGVVTVADKGDLKGKLKTLGNELDRYLANEYGVKPGDKASFGEWVKSHQPFHWFLEFYGIVSDGGFNVIIGNPPYLEIREVDYGLKNYSCLESGAIHAMCVERSEGLLHKTGCMSMIVPLSLPSTQRMEVVQQLLEEDRNAWYANYAWRPAKLFDSVNRALTIFVVTPTSDRHTFSTNYQKWTSDDRSGLMQRLNYVEVLRKRPACWIPKLGDSLERQILNKCLAVKTAVKHFAGKSEYRVYYRTDGGLYWKVFTDFAPAFNLNGKKGHSSRETWFTVGKKDHVKLIIAALSSDVFWWWYTVTSNLRHLNPFDVQNFPLPESSLADAQLQALGARYLKDLEKNSTMLVREQKQTGATETQSFKIQKSKPIIDEIDTVLARHYGFTAEELDFILNYDIKYRLGRDTESEHE
jgi:hypothetical protein